MRLSRLAPLASLIVAVLLGPQPSLALPYENTTGPSLMVRGIVSPVVSDKCWSHTSIIKSWKAGWWQRYKIKFQTNKPGIRDKDYEMASHLWDGNHNDVMYQRCSAFCKWCHTGDVKVYFDKEYHTWVIDSSEAWGPIGVQMTFMALRRFAWRWEAFTGCQLDTLSDDVFFAKGEGHQETMKCWKDDWVPGEHCPSMHCWLDPYKGPGKNPPPYIEGNPGYMQPDPIGY